ncbi:MAG: HAD-IB family hydrolase [Deltaproteobacteria bacterium]|nr:HAD-IB family hydrolase [Deltaproteobacteria bacterium]
MEKKRAAAFFDFDRTLLTVESGKLGLYYMWERGEVPLGFLLRAAVRNVFFRLHLYSDQDFLSFLLTYYKGKPMARFKEEAEEFYRHRLKPRLAPNILERVAWHKKAGHVLVLISGSLRYILEPAAKDLGFDHLVSTVLETDARGILTGRAVGPLCLETNKKILAAALAQKEKIDLSVSWAYGNHQSDLPLLLSVGHPVVVEPTRPLLKEAGKHGWPVLSYGTAEKAGLKEQTA